MLEGDQMDVMRGSPLYMAPEIICRKSYDARVDLWSIGVILYGRLAYTLIIIAIIIIFFKHTKGSTIFEHLCCSYMHRWIVVDMCVYAHTRVCVHEHVCSLMGACVIVVLDNTL